MLSVTGEAKGDGIGRWGTVSGGDSGSEAGVSHRKVVCSVRYKMTFTLHNFVPVPRDEGTAKEPESEATQPCEHRWMSEGEEEAGRECEKRKSGWKP